jgi:hypothetical protein
VTLPVLEDGRNPRFACQHAAMVSLAYNIGLALFPFQATVPTWGYVRVKRLAHFLKSSK